MKKFKIYLNGFLLINLLWLLFYLIFHRVEIPNQLEVYSSFRLFFKEDICIDVILSFSRIAAGVLIALFLGSLLGYVMAIRKKINSIISPLVVFLNPIPKAVFFPVIFVVLGPGECSLLITITLVILLQIVISVRDTVFEINKDNVDYLISLGCSRKQLFTNVIIPDILPGIIFNIGKKLRTAISILFFCEAFGNKRGIGSYVFASWQRKDYISMYKGVFVVCILGIILFQIIEFTEYKLVKHKSVKIFI